MSAENAIFSKDLGACHSAGRFDSTTSIGPVTDWNCLKAPSNLLLRGMNRLLTTHLRMFVVCSAILALVYSLGVCPGGCLESNQWYALAHEVFEHDHEQPECPLHDHGDCDCEEAEITAIVAAHWEQPDVTSVWIVGLFVSPLERPLGLHVRPAYSQIEHPIALAPSLRAHCQLFRC